MIREVELTLNTDNFTEWRVTFAHDWVTLTTYTQARDEDEAVSCASEMLTDFYGWDLSRFSAEANNDNEVTA